MVTPKMASIRVGGVVYSTFSETDGKLAQDCREFAKAVRISWKKNGNFRDIVSMEPIDPSGAE